MKRRSFFKLFGAAVAAPAVAKAAEMLPEEQYSEPVNEYVHADWSSYDCVDAPDCSVVSYKVSTADVWKALK